ncbi:hypothetical protein FRC06_007685 [Ceratobasidium sp. 370]|nr:hypothetical protein FRC06_007685 [Ceratobasidium sp. 370]
MRDGDTIGPGNVPRGTRRSPGGRHQAYRANLLYEQRMKNFDAIGQPHLCPPLMHCFPSRNLHFHYRQVLMFCAVVNTIDKRSVTPNDVVYAQDLLQTVCIGYAENNIPLPPNFHYLMHLEESVLKYASIYNSHVWAMERANGMLGRIRHNGRSRGVLEGTLMRGWWSYTKLQNLIYMLRNLRNRTPSDDAIIEDLLVALRGGPEHAQERGTLMAFIAQCHTAYTRLHGIQEATRLSKQSRKVDLERIGIYELILDYCQQIWPEEGIFGNGQVRDLYLPPEGVATNYSFVEYDGIRYGAHTHTSGLRYCYAYIDGRYPVRIERVLLIDFPGYPRLRTICVLIRRFCVPEHEPRFPWDAWAGRLGVSSWAYNELAEIEAVPIGRFSGVFALFDVPMLYRHYWVTMALDSVSPEQDELDE